MKPGESKLENRTIKQADGNFTRYVKLKWLGQFSARKFFRYLNHGINLTPDNVCYISNFFTVKNPP